MKNKPIVEVKVEDMEYPNFSIGYLDGKEVEFKGGLLGQTCRVKITRNRNNSKKAKFLETIKLSELEEKSDYCPNSGVCGGCAYQRLNYENELNIKKNMIEKLIKDEKLNYFNDLKINPSPKQFEYRNKMEYTFGDSEKDGPLVLGLHKLGRFYEIVDTKDCNIVDSDFNAIREEIQNYFRKKNFSFYHRSRHDGLLRHAIVRKALNTGEIMIILVTSSESNFNDIEKKEFVDDLLNIKLNGKIKSVYHVTNDSLADAVVVEKIDLLFGNDFIEEEMMGLKFRISPFSFFQPNVYSAEKLYEKAFEFAEVNENSKVLDLYSGTGTITQVMAKKAKLACGIEIVEEAVEKAKENSKLNNIENISFLAGDVLEEIEKVKGDFDTIILDPPREGIHPKAIDKIISINPEKFVYISCNPKTQVRDLKIFEENNYQIKNYEIFDQFANSRHVETIALIEKK